MKTGHFLHPPLIRRRWTPPVLLDCSRDLKAHNSTTLADCHHYLFSYHPLQISASTNGFALSSISSTGCCSICCLKRLSPNILPPSVPLIIVLRQRLLMPVRSSGGFLAGLWLRCVVNASFIPSWPFFYWMWNVFLKRFLVLIVIFGHWNWIWKVESDWHGGGGSMVVVKHL